MFTVALIGPDGVGKTTIGRQIERQLPLPVKYLYMGFDPYSSNHMLPTSRLIHAIRRARGGKKDTAGPRDPDAADAPRRGMPRRVFTGFKAAARLVNRISEQWYRQALAWYFRRRRYIVLFDRHFFADYYAYDVADDIADDIAGDIAGGGRRRPLSRRIHGFLLKHVYPKPDLTIYLDAPAEVLLARKGEGTVESLRRRREDYLRLAELTENFAVVDAGRSLPEVTGDVMRQILKFYEITTGNAVEVCDESQQAV